MPVSAQVQLMETEIFKNIEHQLMDVEYDDQNIEYQSEDVIAKSSTKNLKKTVPYIPKGKGHIVMFAEIASRNLDVGSTYDISSTPSASDSKAQPVKKKQQCASPKEIQSVMTRYDLILKNNVQEITLYNIPSTWTQLELLQHLEKWGYVIAFKTKR
ncbi:hypothetical protein RirG_242440 [Rhizophagus irregularis DAOM 197198w]|uniref:Uncharacterized protein n=1 Tax=Rhizophagus irregularis (strain DAOM 197198w) TaxID=1432141 RepID=A0A015I8T3_RHIIW|nr:hypothetical protein RirG_242440 [Rhizophagus irregularis DAOM 197198w]